MTNPRVGALGWIFLAALFCVPRVPSANGRFPQAQQVVIGPGPRSDVIALRVTFGLILSTDGGRTFRWLCEEGMYFPDVPRNDYDPGVEVDARGAVVFSYASGIRHSSDGCESVDVPGTPRRNFMDLTSDPTGRTLYAVEATDGMRPAVWRIDGMTRESVRSEVSVPELQFFDTIEVAPSNPRRLYVSARAGVDFQPVFYRSDDGGMTLTRVVPDTTEADSFWVSGVDPRDPNTLYVRAAMGLGTELRRSRDGGRSFQRVASIPDPMLGFALSDDGRTIWIGGITSGLLRSDDGGDSFSPVNRLPVLCLRQHAGVLWACSEWIAQPFVLGRSRDRGATFEPMVTFTNFSRFQGPPVCGARSKGAEICVERWPIFQREITDGDLLFDAGVIARPDGAVRRDAGSDAPPTRDGGLDAGAMDATPPRDGGIVTAPREACNCTAPGQSGRPRWLATLAAITALAFVRRRARQNRERGAALAMQEG